MLAPLLAGRPRVRESRSGGHSYQRRWERPLTARLPAVPAAVPIYSGAGDTRVLVVDLDASRGGRDAVRRDAAAVTDLVRAAGGRVITDESPSGGWHVYVPFSEPIGFHDARDLALALAARTPTMDPSPNQNLTDGLIRPPGSVHPSGGHQVLHGPLTAALRAGRHRQPTRRARPRSAACWPAELAAVAAPRPARPPDADRRRRRAPPAAVRRPGARRGLPADRDHRPLRHRQVPVTRPRPGRPCWTPRSGPASPCPPCWPASRTAPGPASPPSTPGTAAPEPAGRAILADWRKARRLRHRQQAKKPTAEPCP